MSDKNYDSLVDFVKKSIREGDRSTAKKVAHFLVDHYPQRIEGLLLLAGLSNPKKSLIYLKQAEKIDPNNPLFIKALHWAESQIRQPAIVGAGPGIEGHASTIEEKSIRVSQQAATEKRGLVWLWALAVIFVLVLLFLGMGAFPRNPNRVSSHFNVFQSTKMIKPTLTATPGLEIMNTPTVYENTGTPVSTLTPTITFTPTSTPTPTATPTVIPDLYGCDMELRFTSGPLEGYGTTFKMIDRDYFYDKSDKFATGKNTGVFYENQRYLILHSGYLGGDFSKPLEAEFIRKYLELWGNNDTAYIEGQIQSLLGSEMIWICNSQQAVNLKFVEVVRLSHESSGQLWVNPANILQIIDERKGEPAEWIGDIENDTQKSVYLGFCGWGPPGVTQNRSIYYRYVLRFDIVN